MAFKVRIVSLFSMTNDNLMNNTTSSWLSRYGLYYYLVGLYWDPKPYHKFMAFKVWIVPLLSKTLLGPKTLQVHGFQGMDCTVT